MSDKILKESLDRIKEIEESDDPFCLNNESVNDWATPTEYDYEDDSGHHYSLTYQDDGGKEVGYLEVDGVTAAYWEVGGAGPLGGKVVKPELVLLAIESIMTKGK